MDSLLFVTLFVFVVLQCIIYFFWKIVSYFITKKYQRKEDAVSDVSEIEFYESRLITREIRERKDMKFVFSLLSLGAIFVALKFSKELLLRYDILELLSELLNKV